MEDPFLNGTFNSSDVLEEFETGQDFWTLIEYTNYFFYSLVFLIGIIGNTIVIYVILSPICCNSKSNRDHFGYHNQAHFYTNHTNAHSPAVRKKSIRTRSAGSSLRKPKASNVNEDILNLEKKLVNLNKIETHRPIDYVQQASFADESRCFSCKEVRSFFTHLFAEKLSTTNFYLFNLALADFMFLSTIPILICTIFYKGWIFSSLLCKVYYSFYYLLQSNIAFILVVLSVDRYLSVMYPHKVTSFRNTEIARGVIFVCWTLSFVLVTPVAIYAKTLEMENGVNSCSIEWPLNWNFSNATDPLALFLNNFLNPSIAFQIYIFFFNYLMPVTIIVILYANILRKLHQKSKIKKSKTKTKSHRKITRMVLYIVIGFVVCWTPYWSGQILNYITSILEIEVTFTYIFMSQLMSIVAYCSSALNPFIYSYMSESFRASLKSEFSGCCCWFEDTTHHEQQNVLTHQIHHEGSLVSRSKSLRSTIRGSFRSFRSEKNFQSEHHIQQSKMLTTYFIQNKQKLIKSSAINNFQSANSSIQLANFNRVDSLYSDPDTQQDSFAETSEGTRKQSLQDQKRDSVISNSHNIKEEGEDTAHAASLFQITTNDSETVTNTTKNTTCLLSVTSPVPTVKSKANKEIKTYIYRTKSNLAFAINFHSLSAKKNLILGNKVRTMNDIKSLHVHNNTNNTTSRDNMKHVKFKQFDQVKHKSNVELNEVV